MSLQAHPHREELGRVCGATVPPDEVQILEANGWAVVEDNLPGGFMFMAAPAAVSERSIAS